MIEPTQFKVYIEYKNPTVADKNKVKSALNESLPCFSAILLTDFGITVTGFYSLEDAQKAEQLIEEVLEIGSEL